MDIIKQLKKDKNNIEREIFFLEMKDSLDSLDDIDKNYKRKLEEKLKDITEILENAEKRNVKDVITRRKKRNY